MMKNLASTVLGEEDLFNDAVGMPSDLVALYFDVNERKKEDEKWLKKTKPVIEKHVAALGRDKVDVGDLRVSVTIPDTSKFDMEKVGDFLSTYDHINCFKMVVDEERLAEEIERGNIDLEVLKAHAWVASKGAPRLTINKLKPSED